jgi:hypothetical protein
MMQPGMMADYNAQLGRNIQGYQTSLMPFQAAANMLPGTYANPVVNPGSPGFMQSAMQLAAPFAMGAGMGWGGGGFQNPFAGMFGGGGAEMNQMALPDYMQRGYGMGGMT